ncbi:VanZ family protein [Bacillus thermotolerans]|uniref:VanZ-like domain-containing protein n=1 Tax=Bacillus thermotolerans TaxID=1221996 RepID=A0A0F5I6U5_BACTR|nr:VanZ family protein [Bacillus thermotolerans]KKB41241.1 hypothetical protein QY95_00948 [Bacillus thermotolerans]
MKGIFKVMLLLAIAGVIYLFSSQTYEQQSIVPLLQKVLANEPLAGPLSQIELTYWGREISVESRGYHYFVEFMIRKFAHMLLFGLLAIGLFRVYVWMRPKQINTGVILALIITGMYAAFDEWHQLQTGGRTPMIQDVVLDLIGGMIALVLYVPVYALRHGRKKK